MYRLKVVPHDASPTVLPWGMSAVVIRGDVLPAARVAPPSPAMRAYTAVPSFHVEVGKTFAVTANVLNDSYVASGVQIESVLVPSGVELRHVEMMRLDGETMTFLDALKPLTLGNIPPSWSRAATYVFAAQSPGPKTFMFRVWSENSGEINVSGTVNVVPVPVDLTVTGLDDEPGRADRQRPGATFSVTDTVQNLGPGSSGSSKTRYYLSLDAVKSPGDMLLSGTIRFPLSAAGASHSAAVTLTVPAAHPARTITSCWPVPTTGRGGRGRRGQQLPRSPGATVTVTQTRPGDQHGLGPAGTAMRGGKFSVSDTAHNLGAVASGPPPRATTSRSMGRRPWATSSCPEPARSRVSRPGPASPGPSR